MGDVDDIAFMCDLAASLIEPPGCHEGEEALVVLRRPAPPDPSPADEHIFRLIRATSIAQSGTLHGLLRNRAAVAGVSACGPAGFLTGSVDG